MLSKRLKIGMLLTVFAMAMLVANVGLCAEKVTIEFWLTDYNPDTKVLFEKKLIPIFEEKHPNIELQMVEISWDHFDEKMMTAFAGGVAPDIVQPGAEYAWLMAKKRLGRPIDDYVEKWAPKDDFYKASWGTVVEKGHVYGVPYLTSPRTIQYRKDIFREVGLDPNKPPETWEELHNYAVKLTQRKGRRIIRLGYNAHQWAMGTWTFGMQPFMPFLWQNGGRVLSEDGTEAVFNSPEGVEALTFMERLYGELVPPGTATLPESPIPYFATGQLAMTWEGLDAAKSVYKYAPEHTDDIGVAFPTKRKDRKTAVFTDWLCITTQSKHPEEAFELIKFLTEKENLIAYDECFFFVPPRKACEDSDYIQENPVMKKIVQVLALTGKAIPHWPESGKLYDAASREIAKALVGKKTPQQALDDAVTFWNEIITENL